jgi:hypothetical protein
MHHGFCRTGLTGTRRCVQHSRALACALPPRCAVFLCLCVFLCNRRPKPSELICWIPQLGWHDTAIYCTLPVLIVVAQLVSSAITKAGAPKKKPAEASGDGSMETIVALLPFLIGWFAMNLPAGCALYWLINTTFTTAQQVYIKSLFKPALEVAGATPAVSTSTVNIVTEAEKKMQEQASEDVALRGFKAAYKVFDDFLGMGLPEAPSPEEAAAKKVKDEEGGMLSPLDKDFWIKDDSKAGKLKDAEKDEIRAKFLAAKAAREAKKKAASSSAPADTAAPAAAVTMGASDDGLDV